MLSIYPACFFREGQDYSVVFPDLNYLATQGSTLNEAMEMAVDCLAGHIYVCRKENRSIPEPSLPSMIDTSKIARELDIIPDDILVNMVSVDVSEYAKKKFEKAVKKTLTIPAWLNKEAMDMGINFSQTLQEALISKVEKERGTVPS